MTSPEVVLATAERWRAGRVIYRHTPGGYVSTQQAPPYTGANDRFGTGYVDHCGIGVANIYAAAGLEFAQDYPETMQMSTWLAADILADGWATDTPQAGGIGVIDWERHGYGATGASDHVTLLIRPELDRGTVVTLECNTTPDGALYYYRRRLDQFTAWGAPKWRQAPTGPATLLIPAYA